MADEVRVNPSRWPPCALPAPSRPAVKRMRAVWTALLVLAVAIQLAGFAFVLFDAYRIKPATRAAGFAIEFGDDDRAVVRPQRADMAAAGVVTGAQIVSIADHRFDRDSSELSLARALIATPGDVVRIGFRNPDGTVVRARISRSSRAPLLAPPPSLSANVRLMVRLVFTLLCSLALLGSSLLLLRRRPDDPESILFGVAFLGIAAGVDPSLLFWLGIGAGWMVDVITAFWWTPLVIALAAFPDGRFTPSALRWVLVGAPLLGVALAADWLGDIVSVLVGVGVPLLLLAAQVPRYRRLGAGIERQQIKWAALGFAAGFLLAGISLGMSLAPYDNWRTEIRVPWVLATVCLFNLAFALLPLGLLVSLIRFRLWEVDRVITRSAALTLVTGSIGLLWALLSDVAKQVIAALMGEAHSTAAVVLGAVIAAGLFAPTQRVVMQWSKQRFNRPRLDLERLPERLRSWSRAYEIPEVAARALDVVVRALHAPGGAVLARTPTGRKLLASRGGDDWSASTASTGAAAHGHILHLEDEDGLAGWLILAPREDGSQYGRSDLAALADVIPALTNVLRAAASSARPGSAALGVLDEVQQRLAELEQRMPRPA